MNHPTPPAPKHDLRGPEDIRAMVDGFYAKVHADPMLAPIFNDVAKIDWDHHMPTMYKFWESLLFQTGDYRGNPFMKHVVLPLKPEHFQAWLSLFLGTVDELFEGPKANEAKARAMNIARMFQMRMGLVEGGIPLR